MPQNYPLGSLASLEEQHRWDYWTGLNGLMQHVQHSSILRLYSVVQCIRTFCLGFLKLQEHHEVKEAGFYIQYICACFIYIYIYTYNVTYIYIHMNRMCICIHIYVEHIHTSKTFFISLRLWQTNGRHHEPSLDCI